MLPKVCPSPVIMYFPAGFATTVQCGGNIFEAERALDSYSDKPPTGGREISEVALKVVGGGTCRSEVGATAVDGGAEGGGSALIGVVVFGGWGGIISFDAMAAVFESERTPLRAKSLASRTDLKVRSLVGSWMV